MKKLYTIILIFALTFTNVNSNATTHFVNVGVNSLGVEDNVFTPALVTAVAGDSVCWTQQSSMTHTVTDNGTGSMVLPASAAIFNSGNLTTIGQKFGYRVWVTGTYTYSCTLHSGMNAYINVATGINEAMPASPTVAFPSPCANKISFAYNGIDEIELFNLIGEKLSSTSLSASASKFEMDVATLPEGIYFYRTYRDGLIVETKKIIKSK